jgi:hypothetical protein
MFCDDLLATGFIEAGFKAKVPNQAPTGQDISPTGQDISQKLPEVARS